MRRGTAACRLVALAAAVLVCAGCGISAESQPRALSASPEPSSSTTASTTSGLSVQATIYLVVRSEDKLKAVQRLVPSRDPSPADLLQALQDDVSDEDQAKGYLTGVRGCSLVDNAAGASPTRVTVEVPTDFLTTEPLAFGQIVLTLTRLSTVNAVQFVRGGMPIDVPNAAGMLLNRPVTNADYADLLSEG